MKPESGYAIGISLHGDITPIIEKGELYLICKDNKSGIKELLDNLHLLVRTVRNELDKRSNENIFIKNENNA